MLCQCVIASSGVIWKELRSASGMSVVFLCPHNPLVSLLVTLFLSFFLLFFSFFLFYFFGAQSAILALDDTILDADQVENLIKFTPTKDEIELLKVARSLRF